MPQGSALVERCFSLSGLLPLPVFVLLHLSHELGLAFASDVSELIRSEPDLVSRSTSLLLVWLPLSAHVLGGVWLLLARRELAPSVGEVDTSASAKRLSRLTATLALLFVVYHCREFEVAAWLGEADRRDAGLRLVALLSSTNYGVPLRAGFYLLGLAATVAHAGLGVHRALLRQGLLTTPGRRRASARLCAGTAALAFVLGALAVIRVASGVLLH